MSSGFVKTAVLEGGDSCLGNETRIESEDVKRQEFRNAQAAARPLYEQLEENREKKEAEYDAVTKAIFAPTKALDEEEAQHMNDIEDRKRTDRMLQKTQEDKELDEFKYARLSRTLVAVPDDGNAGGSGERRGVSSAPTAMRIPAAAPRAPALDVKINIKARKRKAPGQADAAGGGSGVPVKAPKPAATAVAVAAKPVTALPDRRSPGRGEEDANPLAALGGYGDSDSD